MSSLLVGPISTIEVGQKGNRGPAIRARLKAGCFRSLVETGRVLLSISGEARTLLHVPTHDFTERKGECSVRGSGSSD